MQFNLHEDELERLEIWKQEVLLKGVELQKATITDPGEHHRFCWESGFPYAGAIAGQFSYTFIPTSIGTTVIVKDAITGEEIDLTDYNMW